LSWIETQDESDLLTFEGLVSSSFSFACPKENEAKEKGTTVKDTFPR